jgi:signal transduction histidine kinase
MINVYSFPTFVTSILVFVLASIVYAKNKTNPANRAFFLICQVTSIWLFFSSIAYNLKEESSVDFFMRICYVGIIFIPATVFHFTNSFLGINRRKVIIFFYIIGLSFSTLLLTKDYLISGVYRYFWGYYPRAGKYHPAFLSFFVLTASFCFYELLLRYFSKATLAIKRDQIKYIILAFLFFSIASLDFIPNYGIEVYASGYIFVFGFLAIIAYSVIRYRLMNISLVVTRTGIFILVYSLVLGVPFAIAFGLQDYLAALLGPTWWIIPLITSTILGTVGPFLYLFIQKRAEDRLLSDQRRYQSTLRQASAGMSRIKDLKKLLNLIVYILARAVNLNHCVLYLYDEANAVFSLEAVRGKRRLEENNMIEKNCAFIKYLDKIRAPIVYEEMRQRAQDYGTEQLREVELKMKQLDTEVAVPIFTEQKILAIGMLGKKKSGEMYTPDDLAVFSILATQVALAIENAQFYEESKKTQAQLFQAEKMATIGTMADGLSHQINNRLHALGFIAGDALDSIKLKSKACEQSSAEVQDLMRDVAGSLLKIQDNVRQGGEIVQGLLRYTRKGEEGFAPVSFDKLVNASVEMAQFKIKKDELMIIKDYPKDVPDLYGNFTQLQEVLFNVIDNSYDAIVQRRGENSDPLYRGKLKISTRQIDDYLEINILDNGMGIKEEDLNKLFTPFFTTKLSSKKGTGLGLYVMRKIIEENHAGHVVMSSEYMVGTLTVITLPVAKK